jgi:magnesium-transporting ATPase (P-type)
MNDQTNPYTTPQSELSNLPVENSSLKGIQGWLILVSISVVLSPIILLVTLIPMYIPIFEDGTWELLTTVGSESYHSMWAPLLIAEIIYNCLMVLASGYLIYLFFSKHYFFPKFYICLVIASLIFILVDAWLLTKILPDVPMFDPETTKEFTRTLISALIWIPYMLVSKRVKATFVEKLPNKSQ